MLEDLVAVELVHAPRLAQPARPTRRRVTRADALRLKVMTAPGWRGDVTLRRVEHSTPVLGSPRCDVAASAGSPLALVLPVGGLAEAGALDDLEAEQRALHPRRRDLDPEQLEDELLRQPQQLLAASCRPARRSAARSPRSRSRSPCPRRRPRRPGPRRRAGSTTCCSSPQNGLVSSNSRSSSSSRPKLCGRL